MSLSELVKNNVWIIAEIGINHEGCIETCKKLIKLAAEAGANAVKLQTIDPDLNYSPETESYRVFSKAKLTLSQTGHAFEYARKLGVEPFTTVGDVKTLRKIESLHPKCYKVSSGLLTCLPIIEEIVQLGKPIIFSTGMAGIKEIKETLGSIKTLSPDMIAILHCVSLYPTELEDLNLSQIQFLSAEFGHCVGFSDHSGRPEIASHAVMAGAKIIECHITFDKTRPEFDHRVSLDPNEFEHMVRRVRDAEKMLGAPEVVRTKNIRKVGTQMGRYLSTIKDVKKGDELSLENVGFLRYTQTRDLVPANKFKELSEKKFKRNIAAFSPILLQDLTDA
jgi:N,N'-diacetyllegionaminate synthase